MIRLKRKKANKWQDWKGRKLTSDNVEKEESEQVARSKMKKANR